MTVRAARLFRRRNRESVAQEILPALERVPHTDYVWRIDRNPGHEIFPLDEGGFNEPIASIQGMSRQLRMLDDPSGLVEVTSRTQHGRFLMHGHSHRLTIARTGAKKMGTRPRRLMACSIAATR